MRYLMLMALATALVCAGCHEAENLGVGDQYEFSVSNSPATYAANTPQTISAHLRVDLSDESDGECPAIEHSQLDFLVRYWSEDEIAGDVHRRCSEQAGCSILASDVVAVSSGWDCGFTLEIDGFVFDQIGSFVPSITYKGEEIMPAGFSMGSSPQLEVREAVDLWVSFNGMDNISAIEGTIGCIEAALVDTNGYLLLGGDVSFDLDEAPVLASYTDEVSVVAISGHGTAFEGEILIADSAGSGMVVARAGTLNANFETPVTVKVFDSDEINGLRFFELFNRGEEPFTSPQRGSVSGYYSWEIIEDDLLELEWCIPDWPWNYPETSTVVASLISDAGAPVFATHVDQVGYLISYGGILTYRQWRGPVFGMGALHIVDQDLRNVFLIPNAWNITGTGPGADASPQERA